MITVHKVSNFLLAYWNKFRTRIFGLNWRERQYEWRVKLVETKSPLCITFGKCTHCGCETPDKFWEPDSCEAGCYPEWMDRETWNIFEQTIQDMKSLSGVEVIEIPHEKYKQLYALWFLYGNNGPKSNFNQHRFIQTLLEKNEYDRRWLSKEDNMKNAAKRIDPEHSFNDYLVSDDCIQEVDKILSNDKV